MIQRRSEFKSCSVLNMACVSRPVLKPSLKAYSDSACLRSDSEHNEHPPHITSKSCVMRGVSKVSKAKLKTTKTPYRLWTSPSTRHAILSVIILYILFLVIPATIEGCYVFPTGKKDPCEDEQCHFLAVCVASSDGKEARCQCIDECNDYGTSQGNTEICGDDGNDYKNWCELKKAACNSMTEIKIKYYGRCEPCDGIECSGQQVCRVNEDHMPECKCQASCDQVVSHVCGTDGRTYSNQCMLRQQACQMEEDISVRYPGPCQDENPCSSLQCGPNHDCLIDRMGQAACTCPSVCATLREPVCGTDGLTYNSVCELRRRACQRNEQTAIARNGPCEERGPCLGYNCDFDGVCVVGDNGRPMCRCPVCNVKQHDPVCGDNGITYNSDCELRAENCDRKRKVDIEHRGYCMSKGCERNSAVCKYHSTCERASNGRWRCVCPSDCLMTGAKVCGTDGVTYDNECELRKAGCRKQIDIVIASFGDCVKCNDRYCKYGAKCEYGQCKCPQKCLDLSDPICASDGETYRNECEMKKAACRQGRDLRIVKSGDCDDDLQNSGEGSGDLECDESTCQYGGTCQLEDDGGYRCVCSFSCDAIRSPVCGSDGNSYGNKCEMLAASCRLQKLVMVQSWENCDFDEDLCDGASPEYNPATGAEYTCDGPGDCPAGSYCHLQFRRCCSEEKMSDTVTRDCSETEFGCCDDKVTSADGPNKLGCPDTCQCELIGSVSTTCHPDTKKCTCKTGVGGLKCDSCLPGYWGLHLSEMQGTSGCIECQCSHIGARRMDCDQNTGRCTCKDGYDGHKCDICSETRQPVGKHGCYGPQTCDDLICQYGATCQYKNHFAQCVCDFSCPERDFPSSGYVCASNGITYINECKMRKDSCLTQRDIRYLYSGPCQADDPHSATPFPITTRSRKTTRRDITSLNANTGPKTKYTPKPPTTITDEFGRIDDLCLENSYCLIPHSHCKMLLCKCDPGYIPTMENTMCSPVKSGGSKPHVVTEDSDPCELNNCLHGGICKPDEDLGYRCLCSIGRTGIYCKQRISIKIPSFSGSSYLLVEPMGRISGDFYLNIVFHAMNRDGVILYSSQFQDGTGQFISLALTDGHIEFRYDTGGGPKQIEHPHPISQEKYHRVIVKKMGQNAMLIVDESEPMAIISIDEPRFLDLSGKFYLGSLPQNLSFIQEKIVMNLGFVGCVRSMTAGHMDNATIYNLEYPSVSSHIIDGIDITPCEMNPCQSIPCMNGGTCNMINSDYYQCWCPKGYTGENCDAPVDPCTNSPCHPSATCSIGSRGEIICNCPMEREGHYCEYEKLSDVRVPEFFGDSYLVLQVSDSLARQMSIEIWFKTDSRNGVLLFTTQYIGGGGDFISLNLVESFLEFRFDLGDGPVVIRSADRVKMNTWHKVVIQRVNREADLVMDDGEPSRGMSQGSLSELQFSGSMYIGGFQNERDLPLNGNIRSNFTGVIQRLYVNGALLENMIGSALEKVHVNKYIGPPCNVNPCMNGGVCMPKMEQAECKCPKKYIGQHCEKVAKLADTSDPVRFTGQTYLQYFNDITQGHRAQRSNKFQFRFKTHKNSGMLVFQNQGVGVTGDYLALAISGGFVELSFNLGKQTKENLLLIRSRVYVSDDEWHTVSAERDRREGRLQVDKESLVTDVSESGATQLDTDSYLWIGGKADLPWGLPTDYYTGFSGCLGDVFIKDKELHLFEHRNGATSTVIDFCH